MALEKKPSRKRKATKKPQLVLALYDPTSNKPIQPLDEIFNDTPKNRKLLRTVILRYCDTSEDDPYITEVLGVFTVDALDSLAR